MSAHARPWAIFASCAFRRHSSSSAASLALAARAASIQSATSFASFFFVRLHIFLPCLLHRLPLFFASFVVASKKPQSTGAALTVARLARLALSTPLAPLLRLSPRPRLRPSVRWTSDDLRPSGMREAIKFAESWAQGALDSVGVLYAPCL